MLQCALSWLFCRVMFSIYFTKLSRGHVQYWTTDYYYSVTARLSGLWGYNRQQVGLKKSSAKWDVANKKLSSTHERKPGTIQHKKLGKSTCELLLTVQSHFSNVSAKHFQELGHFLPCNLSVWPEVSLVGLLSRHSSVCWIWQLPSTFAFLSRMIGSFGSQPWEFRGQWNLKGT